MPRKPLILEGSIEAESGIQILSVLAALPSSVYPIFFISILLLFLSALISGSEVAFFSLSPKQIEVCSGSSLQSELAIVSLLQNPKLLLATILILNNLVNVALVTILTFATWQIAGQNNEKAVFILTIAVTAAIVFFGEIVPKVLAAEKNLSFAKFTSRSLNVAAILFKPFAWLLMFLSESLEKRMTRKGYEVSMLELNQAVDITAKFNKDREIFKGIVNFGTKSVKQVMRSRIDITAFDIDDKFHELLEKINEFSYSRIPIYGETIDNIEGVLYVKDLLPYIDEKADFYWQKLIRRNPYFVPETKRIDELLRDFQKMRVHMAIVVDEYGGTSGLVTMEDIIEEIVGEINDEFDNEEEIGYKKIDETTFSFEGKTSLNDFCKIVRANPGEFVDAKGESESIGGLLLELFAKLPSPGEQVEFGRFVFTAVSVDKKRIKSVRVLLKNKITRESV